MDAIGARAKGVAAAARNAAVATHDHLAAETEVYSPAAPLRMRKNQHEVVVDDDFHSYQKNEVLQHSKPGPSLRAEVIEACNFAERSFKLLWTNASKAELKNAHKREKRVVLHVSMAGVTIERTDTKKAEARHGPVDWWQITHWEAGKSQFSFGARASGSVASQTFHFATLNSLGIRLRTAPADVAHSFSAATSAIAEKLGDDSMCPGQSVRVSLSQFAATETGGPAEAPVFGAVKSPGRPLAKPVVLSGGGLSPPPKSRLSKRAGSRCPGATAARDLPESSMVVAQSPTRPFAHEPRNNMPPTEQPDGAASAVALLEELFGNPPGPVSGSN
eukprot:COSAG02_NODE_95_length_37416_cov_60.512742_19_plen_332_part_00